MSFDGESESKAETQNISPETIDLRLTMIGQEIVNIRIQLAKLESDNYWVKVLLTIAIAGIFADVFNLVPK